MYRFPAAGTIAATRWPRFRSFAIISGLVLALMPSIRAANDTSPMQLHGYEAVPVRYGPTNKMVMRASLNNRAATLIIDTGAGRTILDAKRAEAFGVRSMASGLAYGEFIYLNGQRCRIGFINSLRAGNMNFGGGPIALFDSNSSNGLSVRSSIGNLDVDGILGTDILTRYKAIINCRTKYIFFKTDPSQRLQLAHFTVSQKFIQVPMHEEANRAFTVACSINGRPGRLVVDTGAFVTTFDQSLAKSLGMSLQPTRVTGRFSDGVARPISVGQIRDLTIGGFKVPPQKFSMAVLPTFALEHGSAHVDGILGMELLALSHGIIDFDSMSLFLK
jgi:predicted aspartyl protease